MHITMMTLRKKAAGLTLIELMITLAIIAIIAAIAFPTFQDTQRRSRRSTAVSFLTQAQGFMESCYSKSEPRTYANCVLPTAIAAPVAPNNFYTITNALPAVPTATAYTLTATAIGGQLNDAGCTSITLTSAGIKAPAACWPQ